MPRKSLRNRLTSGAKTLLNRTRGVGELPIGLTGTRNRNVGYAQNRNASTSRELKDLTDQILVDRTIENSRRAVELDPTTWSSLISLSIITNTGYDIMGHNDEEADDSDRLREAVKHIREKCRDWNLSSVMWEMDYKSMVDGTCCIRKTVNTKTIDSVNFLLYDNDAYDFIELTNPTNGEVLGYKQKYMKYDIPKNWQEETFDSLANLPGTEGEDNFTPEEIIMPKLFEVDGEGQSLVYKVLDYVYIKREIERAMPVAARRAAVSLGVEVGNSDIQFNFGADPGDTREVKEQKQASAMADIADSFAEKEKKDLIVYPYGVRPNMIGNGKVAEFAEYLDYLKQEIRSALLTPDSRFESQNSNRAVAREQLSGSLGQVTVIDYLREFNKYYLEKYLFDHELRLAGYEDMVGRVFIKYKELELEDELVLAQIAEKLIVMGADPDVIIQTYFKRYITEEQNYKEGTIRRYAPSINGGTVQPTINLARAAAAQREREVEGNQQWDDIYPNRGRQAETRVEEVMNRLADEGLIK